MVGAMVGTVAGLGLALSAGLEQMPTPGGEMGPNLVMVRSDRLYAAAA